jgi:hypothetical protein
MLEVGKSEVARAGLLSGTATIYQATVKKS